MIRDSLRRPGVAAIKHALNNKGAVRIARASVELDEEPVAFPGLADLPHLIMVKGMIMTMTGVNMLITAPRPTP